MSLLVDVAACARVTRLIVSDAITQPWRARLLATHPPGTHERPRPAYVLTCEVCAAPWAALLVLALPRRVRRVLALAELGALLASR